MRRLLRGRELVGDGAPDRVNVERVGEADCAKVEIAGKRLVEGNVATGESTGESWWDPSKATRTSNF